MGDSLAVELGQAAHYRVLREHARALGPGETLVYRQFVLKSDTVDMLSIDDHICLQRLRLDEMSAQPALRDTQIFDNAGDAYRFVGLVRNDDKKRRSLTQGVLLGAELDGRKGLVEPPRERTLSLALLSTLLAKRGCATAELLERVVGCWVHVLMFRRPLFVIACSEKVGRLLATRSFASAIIAHSGDQLFGARGTLPEDLLQQPSLDPLVPRPLGEGFLSDFDNAWGQAFAKAGVRVFYGLGEGGLSHGRPLAGAGSLGASDAAFARAAAEVEQPMRGKLFGLHCFSVLAQLGCVVTSFAHCAFGSPFRKQTAVLHYKPWLCRLQCECTWCAGLVHWDAGGHIDEASATAFAAACLPGCSEVFGSLPEPGAAVCPESEAALRPD
eukprot:s163_g22.t1